MRQDIPIDLLDLLRRINRDNVSEIELTNNHSNIQTLNERVIGFREDIKKRKCNYSAMLDSDLVGVSCTISLDIPEVPVVLHGVTFDLENLLGFMRNNKPLGRRSDGESLFKHPTLNSKFSSLT